jgi:hypothetical protein
MPLKRKDHQSQFPATPFSRTIPVTNKGVSAAKVVATIDVPNNHHDLSRPDKKNSELLLPARRATNNPTTKLMAKKNAMIVQSRRVSFMSGLR